MQTIYTGKNLLKVAIAIPVQMLAVNYREEWGAIKSSSKDQDIESDLVI